MNQIYPMAAAVKMWQQLFIHERQIRFGVEVFGLVPPDKITGGHAHRPQNLLRVAFAPRRNLRLLTAARPSPIQRGRLPKGGFVFIDNYRPFAPGVFLAGDGQPLMPVSRHVPQMRAMIFFFIFFPFSFSPETSLSNQT